MEMWFGYLVGMTLVALGSVWTCVTVASGGLCMLRQLVKPSFARQRFYSHFAQAAPICCTDRRRTDACNSRRDLVCICCLCSWLEFWQMDTCGNTKRARLTHTCTSC